MKQEQMVNLASQDDFERAGFDYFEVLKRANQARGDAFGKAVVRAFSAIKRTMRAAVDRIGKRQRTVDELNALDDRMLHDIGITRGDIPFAANQADLRGNPGNDSGARAA